MWKNNFLKFSTRKILSCAVFCVENGQILRFLQGKQVLSLFKNFQFFSSSYIEEKLFVNMNIIKFFIWIESIWHGLLEFVFRILNLDVKWPQKTAKLQISKNFKKFLITHWTNNKSRNNNQNMFFNVVLSVDFEYVVISELLWTIFLLNIENLKIWPIFYIFWSEERNLCKHEYMQFFIHIWKA